MNIFDHLKLFTSILFINFKPSLQISERNGVTYQLFPQTAAIDRQDDDDDDDDGAALIGLGELLIPAIAVGIVSIIYSLSNSKEDCLKV